MEFHHGVYQGTPDQLRRQLRQQLEYYFSKQNLINDIYLQSQMDAENFVPISVIANFKLIKRLTDDVQLVTSVLQESSSVEVDIEGKKVRSSERNLKRKRCTIILRNVPFETTESEIFRVFLNNSCSIPVIKCERILESDCWYVTFNDEDQTQNAFLYITRENISIGGQRISARIKDQLWQEPSIPPQQSPPAQYNLHLPSYHYHPQNQPPMRVWYIPPRLDFYSSMRSNKLKSRIVISKSGNSIKLIHNQPTEPQRKTSPHYQQQDTESLQPNYPLNQ